MRMMIGIVGNLGSGIMIVSSIVILGPIMIDMGVAVVKELGLNLVCSLSGMLSFSSRLIFDR